MVFDEWIANGGRDFIDALVSPDGQIWIIDHEKALAGGDNLSVEEIKARRYSNVLAETVAQEILPEELPLFCTELRGAIEGIMALDLVKLLEESAAIAYLTNDQTDTVRILLTERQNAIKSLMEERLGITL